MTSAARGLQDHAEHLSALADGELDPASVAAACDHWRDDESARERWHGYQLIGDVLRSEDLASTAAHDSAFLSVLRARLDAEPVVLAPAPLAGAESVAASDGPVQRSAGRSRRQLTAVAAVAAGFVVVVAGALSFNRSPTQELALAQPAVTAGPAVAVAGTVPSALLVASTDRDGNPVAEPQALVANGNLIRDARLDRYLAAHQQWSGGSVIGGHAAFLRHVAADAPKR